MGLTVLPPIIRVKVMLPLYVSLSRIRVWEVQFHSFLSSELDVRKRSASRRIRFTLEVSSWYSWVGHTAGTNSFEKRHIVKR